jgi:hypothetical protein
MLVEQITLLMVAILYLVQLLLLVAVVAQVMEPLQMKLKMVLVVVLVAEALELVVAAQEILRQHLRRKETMVAMEQVQQL